jgi:hypothetical protein
MRAIRTTLRSLHVVAISAYYGGSVFAVPDERLGPALAAVLATGSAFLLFEVWRAPQWLHQLRGLCTFGKLALFALAVSLPEQRALLLTAAVVIGVVVSHAPSRFRYLSPISGEVNETDGKG